MGFKINIYSHPCNLIVDESRCLYSSVVRTRSAFPFGHLSEIVANARRARLSFIHPSVCVCAGASSLKLVHIFFSDSAENREMII